MAWEEVQAAAVALSYEVRELSLGTRGLIERIVGPPSPLRFLRDFVMPGKPCIVSNSLLHWPALRLWSNAYLRSVLQHQLVSVHLTPDGFADAPVDLHRISSVHGCVVAQDPALDASSSNSVDVSAQNGATAVEDGNHFNAKQPLDDEVWFASAHVELMPFPMALDLILASGRHEGAVAYAQQQNGCFLTEYGKLAADAETHIPWATEALGCMPEAVNLWIGNEKAITSFHKDHYENLYAVIAGEKHFTLLPPTDVHALYLRQYPAAHYTRKHGKFTIELDKPLTSVPWVSVDPYPPPQRVCDAQSKFPKYFGGPKPFTCTLQAGEILYLPSMWYHHVRQSPDSEGRTIALNFWYDMQFDIKYAYFNFLESLIHKE